MLYSCKELLTCHDFNLQLHFKLDMGYLAGSIPEFKCQCLNVIGCIV